MNRRNFIKFTLGAASMLAWCRIARTTAALAEDIEKITKPDSQWQSELSREQFSVLRREGTEHPFTSPLLNEHRDGVYSCVGCDLPLFLSKYKYDSGTGWPSFFDCISGHVETTADYKLIIPRTEYHCARCGSHHGHIFSDGPKPTGLRYCSNGIALNFTPDKA